MMTGHLWTTYKAVEKKEQAFQKTELEFLVLLGMRDLTDKTMGSRAFMVTREYYNYTMEIFNDYN